MKNILSLILLFLSLNVIAQPKSDNSDFVILTSKFEQLTPILLAAQNLGDEGDFQVVLYGKEVTEIRSDQMTKYLEWATKLKVRISVCQLSLDKLKIEPDSFPKEIGIVDNAFLYSFQLQKNGYKTLNL